MPPIPQQQMGSVINYYYQNSFVVNNGNGTQNVYNQSDQSRSEDYGADEDRDDLKKKRTGVTLDEEVQSVFCKSGSPQNQNLKDNVVVVPDDMCSADKKLIILLYTIVSKFTLILVAFYSHNTKLKQHIYWSSSLHSKEQEQA